MKVKTRALRGALLNIAVSECDLLSGYALPGTNNYLSDERSVRNIIEREKIAIWPDSELGGWFASANEGKGNDYKGRTLHEAALRCYVASRLGPEIELSTIA